MLAPHPDRQARAATSEAPSRLAPNPWGPASAGAAECGHSETLTGWRSFRVAFAAAGAMTTAGGAAGPVRPTTSRCCRGADAAHAARRLDFSIDGAVASPLRWTWDEFRALPSETVTDDIHCVTKWSKLDTDWEGVSVDTLLERRRARRPTYVVAFCDGGYTTNVPLEDLTGGKAWVAFAYDGEPLEPEHGGPARLLVPHLYFWKSAKWVRGLRAARRGRARLLGGARLPQLRRSVAGAALLGRLTLAARATVVDARRRDAARRARSCSTCPAGRATARASTSTSG